jgi:quercetin dioxygenase-like cupin family protein
MKGPADWFTRDACVATVAAPSERSRLAAAGVPFTPGARTTWHTADQHAAAPAGA